MNKTSRNYSSPLRERQTQQTRELILEALTELVVELGTDELSMQQVADRAGVAKRTLYRHFPDRASMVIALTEQLISDFGQDAEQSLETVEDLGPLVSTVFRQFDATETKSRALVLLASDPRHPPNDTRQRSDRWRDLIAASFPDLTQRQHRQLVGLLRVLASSQSWLRLRDEFEIPGHESGELVSFAMEAILDHVRQGKMPDTEHNTPTNNDPLN